MTVLIELFKRPKRKTIIDIYMSPKKSKKQPIKKIIEKKSDNSVPKDEFTQIINSVKEINRMSIISYLTVYEKLSFQEIQKLLGNIAKSTVNHHIQNLIKSEFIEETTSENKDHGNIKYYKLKKGIPSISAEDLSGLSNEEKNAKYLELFNFGKFHFSFMEFFLKQLTRYVDNATEDINQLQKEKQPDKLQLKFDEIIKIVQTTQMSAFPLVSADYQNFMKGLIEYVFSFLTNVKKKPVLDVNEQIFWVLFLSVPYSAIENSKNKNLSEN